MLLLLAGHLVWAIAFPLGLIGAAVAVGLAGPSREAVSPDVLRWTVIVVALLAVWTIVNLFFSAQDVYAHRDPATYNLAGRYLVDHASLRMNTHADIFGSPAGFTDESAGFEDFAANRPGLLAAQGNHLLPVLLAAAGRIAGNAGVLNGNVLFGAAALFAFFGLARRIVGPRYGALATGALAVSLPMLYVSRDTFSESLRAAVPHGIADPAAPRGHERAGGRLRLVWLRRRYVGDGAHRLVRESARARWWRRP